LVTTGLLAEDFVSTISSTNVFHSPQLLHFPIHLGELVPQFWQINMVLVLDICVKIESKLGNRKRIFVVINFYEKISYPYTCCPVAY